MQQLRITFIGGGNMAEALVSGLIRAGHAADHLMVTDIRQASLDALAETYHVQTSMDNQAAVMKADVVVMAVKPQKIQQALTDIKDSISDDTTIISIAAGVLTHSLAKSLGREDAPIVRVMPNTPALVGAGMSVLFTQASGEHHQRAEYILASSGETAWVKNEKQLHAVTAISGSGPAYFFLLTEVMQAAGVSLGLPEDLAEKLAMQTAAGAGKMLVESGRSPSKLRSQVTSPNGTTEAALNILYEQGFPEAVRKAAAAAAKRSKELG